MRILFESFITTLLSVLLVGDCEFSAVDLLEQLDELMAPTSIKLPAIAHAKVNCVPVQIGENQIIYFW